MFYCKEDQIHDLDISLDLKKKTRYTDSQHKSNRKRKDLGDMKRKGIAPLLQKSLKANS